MRKTDELQYDFSSPDLKKQRSLNVVKSTISTKQVVRDEFADDATDQPRNNTELLSYTNEVD